MATIQYTSYKFRNPPLIDENEYNFIKSKNKNKLTYNPFPVKSFWQKYKIVILLYVVGLPLAGLFASFEIGFLEIITGIYAFLLFGGLFSIIPQWASFLTFLAKENYITQSFLKKIKFRKIIITSEI